MTGIDIYTVHGMANILFVLSQRKKVKLIGTMRMEALDLLVDVLTTLNSKFNRNKNEIRLLSSHDECYELSYNLMDLIENEHSRISEAKMRQSIELIFRDMKCDYKMDEVITLYQ